MGTRHPARGVPASLTTADTIKQFTVPLPPSSSSAWQARQALGARLGEIRKDAGLTGRALAVLCGWHESKVSRIEHARTAPSADDIRLWCQHCGAAGETEDLITFLRSVEDMFVEWRRMERTGLKRAQEAVLPLWQRTRIFRAYSSWLIPGAVQTPAYTKAILRAIAARRELPDDTDEAAAVRADRLRLLREGDHRFFVVIERCVGARGQLAYFSRENLRVITTPSPSSRCSVITSPWTVSVRLLVSRRMPFQLGNDDRRTCSSLNTPASSTV